MTFGEATESEAVMPEMTGSEVKLQSDLMSTEQAQPLLLKLTDEQLDIPRFQMSSSEG
jgi:hypothetical protein